MRLACGSGAALWNKEQRSSHQAALKAAILTLPSRYLRLTGHILDWRAVILSETSLCWY